MQLFKTLLICVVLTSSKGLFAQFEIGSTVITFTDESRDRAIETRIFYPALAAGEGVAVSEGKFPVISIGHGFAMNYDSYAYLWEHLVPLGYIIALPTTETDFVTVSHGDFALDLAFVINELQNAGANEASIFYDKVKPTSGIIGHSMGGGAAFLAAAASSSLSTMVSLAAAETDPSAIDAANEITMPTLTFSADEDCVTPAVGNQLDMYENLTPCKGYVTILGGSHCQFANSNAVCELGELVCFGVETISEEAQHTAILEVLTPWLETWLYQSIETWATVEELTGSGTNYTFDIVCANPPTLGLSDESTIGNQLIYPNPVNESIQLVQLIQNQDYQIYDLAGTLVQSGMVVNQRIDISALESGCYIFTSISNQGIQKEKFIKQ